MFADALVISAGATDDRVLDSSSNHRSIDKAEMRWRVVLCSDDTLLPATHAMTKSNQLF